MFIVILLCFFYCFVLCFFVFCFVALCVFYLFILIAYRYGRYFIFLSSCYVSCYCPETIELWIMFQFLSMYRTKLNSLSVSIRPLPKVSIAFSLFLFICPLALCLFLLFLHSHRVLSTKCVQWHFSIHTEMWEIGSLLCVQLVCLMASNELIFW